MLTRTIKFQSHLNVFTKQLLQITCSYNQSRKCTGDSFTKPRYSDKDHNEDDNLDEPYGNRNSRNFGRPRSFDDEDNDGGRLGSRSFRRPGRFDDEDDDRNRFGSRSFRGTRSFDDEDDDGDGLGSRSFRRPGRFDDEDDDRGRFRSQSFRGTRSFDDEYDDRRRFGSRSYRGPGNYQGRPRPGFGGKSSGLNGELLAALRKNSINWKNLDLAPIKKNIYEPHPDTLNRTPEEIEEYYKKNDVRISSSGKCPPPILNFSELNIVPELQDYFSRKMSFTNPTPIQAVTWPIALSGYNMVGISRTGSGKTLGFALPGLLHISQQQPVDPGEGPNVLVLSPTRELVLQIESVFNPIASLLKYKAVPIFGGAKKEGQILNLRKRSEIVIGTPGRLMDLIESEFLKLNKCSYVVIDEADLMLNMGFEPQLRGVLDFVRPDRQILMWSATWPKEIRSLADDYLTDHIRVQVGDSELHANPNIEQHVHVLTFQEKFAKLLDILDDAYKASGNKEKFIIFANTKLGVKELTFKLRKRGIRAVDLHGDLSQFARERTLQEFRTTRNAVLVATAVASRGLDIPDVSCVINYEFPPSIEEYVHRIGRTARSNKKGKSHTFFAVKDSMHAKKLINLLKDSGQKVDPKLSSLAY